MTFRGWIIFASLAVTLSIAALAFLSTHRLQDSHMAPGISEGEVCLCIKPVFGRGYQEKDVIAYRVPLLSDTRKRQRPVRISRIVACPGDTLEIRGKEVLLNDTTLQTGRVLLQYRITPTASSISQTYFESVHASNVKSLAQGKAYEMLLTPEDAARLEKSDSIAAVHLISEQRNKSPLEVFPKGSYMPWNKDYYGPLVIPCPGMEIQLHYKNIALYRRLISVYEANEVLVKNQNIFINGEKTDSYTIKKSYYFVMDDSRDAAFDSRYWGFLPAELISGKLILSF